MVILNVFFNLISNRGMAFITYYDLREAEKAKNGLQDAEVEGRSIDIHYSIPREDEEHDDQDPNNGTLFVCIKDSKEDYTNEDLYNLFRQWGDIKEVRDCKGKPNQKFVELWDLRHSEIIFQQKQNTPFAGGILEIKHAFKSSREKEREREREGGKPIRRKNETTQNNNNTPQYPYSGTQNNNQITSFLTQLLLAQSLAQPTVSGLVSTTTDTSQLQPTLQSLLYSQQPNLQTSQTSTSGYNTLGTNYLQSGYSLPQLSNLTNYSYTTQPQTVGPTSTYTLPTQTGTTLGLGNLTLGTTNTGLGQNTLTGVQNPYNLQTTQTPTQQTTGYTGSYPTITQQTYNPYTYLPK